MTLLHKLRTPATLRIIIWQSPNNPRFYRTRAIVRDGMDRDIARQISYASIKEAQAALLDYLHCTRSLEFSDAEHMSKNSPNFLGRLLKKVSIADSDIGDSITRWLRFHPINEFEPFFESSGLGPCQYKPLLPRDSMFLTDDDLLLENYHVLCNYGVPRNKIGRIYKDAEEVFRYEYGVLALKLRAYGELGLEQYFMVKMIVCSPYILIGDVNVDFIKSIEILSKGGRQYCWIEQHSSENTSYNCSQLHTLLNLFRKTGYNEEDLGMLLSQHPGIIFESSGEKTLSLIGFLFKFGSSMKQICHMFLQFPQLPVGKFLLNLRGCFLFLNEIDMEAVDIQKIICSHWLLMGSCSLKKKHTLLSSLHVGKGRIRNLILHNPNEMKNWVMGSKLGPLPSLGEKQRMSKIKFLIDLGFEENSKEMRKALKAFLGIGSELQERFDCIMQAGLDRKDVIEMVKTSPQILNQKKEVLKMKIDFCVNDLRCPVSNLAAFPSYLSYSIERVKLRVAMHNWLIEQGTLGAVLSLSTILGCTENLFVRKYVKHHPRGLAVWQDLKEKIYS
ncbi:transcription termination factor MTEF18, mitochondrial-like [Euphorbia lathyris]|uniref:transcription termination factor MTEF18, mitochondrial-like n=1 Tax=Euphorbia lathyris TaxID=212925 RepID=UPI003313BA72